MIRSEVAHISVSRLDTMIRSRVVSVSRLNTILDKGDIDMIRSELVGV